MAFSDIMKSSGILSSAIDSYLLTEIQEDDRKRGTEIFSPSLISKGCLIALILDKLGYNSFSKIPDPKLKRIFKNGDDVHERLQGLAEKSGILKLSEVAVKHPTTGMYGTSDGLIWLEGRQEVVIAEFKTINDNMYNNALKGGALESHINQATMYTGMMEIRRRQLRKKYKTEDEFYASTADRIRYYKRVYFNHIKSGRKHKRVDKLKHLIRVALKADELLWNCPNPVSRFTILYENKNNQMFKEFEYSIEQSKFDHFVQLCIDTAKWLKDNKHINVDNIEYHQVKSHVLPKRDPNYYKSCDSCKYCNFKDFCYTHVEEGVNHVKKKKKKEDKRSKNPISRAKARKRASR
jgi:hypothetical protein